MKLHLPVKLRASLIAAIIAVSASVYNARAVQVVAPPSDQDGWTTNNITINGEVLNGNTYTAVCPYAFKTYTDSTQRVGYKVLEDAITELSYDSSGYYYTNGEGARVDVETPDGYYVAGTPNGATDESFIPVTVRGTGTVDSPIEATPANEGDVPTVTPAQIIISSNDGPVSVMEGNTTLTSNELRIANSIESSDDYAGNADIVTSKIAVIPVSQDQGSVVVLEDVSISDYDGDTTPVATEIGADSKLVIVDGDTSAVADEAKQWMNLEGVSSTEGLEYRENSVNLGDVSGAGSLTIVGSKDEEGNGNLTAAIASITGADAAHRFGEVNIANADATVAGNISNATTVSLSNSDTTVGGQVATKGLNVDSNTVLNAVGNISSESSQESEKVDISGSVTSDGDIRLANGKAADGAGIKEGAVLSAGQNISLSNVDAVNPGEITAGGNLTLTDGSTLQDAGAKDVTEGDTTVTVPAVQVGGDLVVEGGSTVSNSILEVDGSIIVGEGGALDNVAIDGGEGIEVTGGAVVGSDIVNVTADINIAEGSTLSAKDGKGFVLTTQGTFEAVDDDTYNGGSIIVDGATLENGVIKSGVTATRGEDGTYSYADVATTETPATNGGVAIGDVKLPYGEINIQNSTLENMEVTTAAGDIQLHGHANMKSETLEPSWDLVGDNHNGVTSFKTTLSNLGGHDVPSVLNTISVAQRTGPDVDRAGVFLQIKDGNTVIDTSKNSVEFVDANASTAQKLTYHEFTFNTPVALNPTKEYTFAFVTYNEATGEYTSVGVPLRLQAGANPPAEAYAGSASIGTDNYSAVVRADIAAAEDLMNATLEDLVKYGSSNTIKGAEISTGNGKLVVDRTYLTRAEDGTRNTITATQGNSTLANSYVEGTDIAITAPVVPPADDSETPDENAGGATIAVDDAAGNDEAAGSAITPATSLTVDNTILRGDVNLAADEMIVVTGGSEIALDGDAANTDDEVVDKDASISASVLYLDELKDNTASIKNGELNITDSTFLKDANTLDLETVSGSLGDLMDVVDSASTEYGASTVNIKGGSELTAGAISTDWKDGDAWSPEAGDAAANNSYFGAINVEGGSQLTAKDTALINNYVEKSGSEVTFESDAWLANAQLVGVDPAEGNSTDTTINGNAHIGNLRLDNEAVLNLVNTGEGEVTSYIANIKPGLNDEGAEKDTVQGSINVVNGTLKTPDLGEMTSLSLGLNGGTVVLEIVGEGDGATIRSEGDEANAQVHVREITNAATAGDNAGESTIKTTLDQYDGGGSRPITKTDGIASLTVDKGFAADNTVINAYEVGKVDAITGSVTAEDGTGTITITEELTGADNVLTADKAIGIGGIVGTSATENLNNAVTSHKGDVAIGASGIVSSGNTVTAEAGSVTIDKTAEGVSIQGIGNEVSATDDVTVEGNVTGEANSITSTEGSVTIKGNVVGKDLDGDGKTVSNSVASRTTVEINGTVAGTVSGEKYVIKAGAAGLSPKDKAISIDTFAAQNTDLLIAQTTEEAFGPTEGNGSIVIGTMAAAKQWDAEGNLTEATVNEELENNIVSNTGNVEIGRMEGANAYTKVEATTGDVIIGNGAEVNDTASNMTITANNLQVNNDSLTLENSELNVEGNITGTSLTLTTTGKENFASAANSVTLDSLTVANNAILTVVNKVEVNSLTMDGEKAVLNSNNVKVKDKATVVNGADITATILSAPELEIINGTLANKHLEGLQGLTATGATVSVTGKDQGLDELTQDVIAQAVYVKDGKAILDEDKTPVLSGEEVKGAELKRSDLTVESLSTTGDVLADQSTITSSSTITGNDITAENEGVITAANGIKLTNNGALQALSESTIKGDVTGAGDVTVDGGSTLDGTVGMAGALAVGKAEDTERSSITGNVTGATGATLNHADIGSLTMAEKAEDATAFTADVTATDSTIGGNITNANDVTLEGTDVTGSVAMDGTLNVTDGSVGAVSGAKAADITGLVQVTDGDFVTGDLAVNKDSQLWVKGDIAAEGKIAINGDIAALVVDGNDESSNISLNGKEDKEGNKSAINANVLAENDLVLKGEFDVAEARLKGSTVDLQGTLNAGKGVVIDGVLTGAGTIKKTGKDKLVVAGSAGSLEVSDQSTLDAADGANLGKLTVTDGSTFEIADKGFGTVKADSVVMAAGTAMMSDANLANGNVDTLVVKDAANLNGASVVLRTDGFTNEAAVAEQTRLSIVKAGSVASSVNEEVLHTLDTLNVHTENTGKSIDLVFSKNYKGVEGKTFNQNQAAAGLASLEAAPAKGELANVLDALHHTRSEADARAALDSLGGAGLAGLQKVMADDTKEHLQTLRSTLKSAAAGVQYRYDENGQLVPGKDSNALAGSVTGGHTEVSGNGNSGEYQRDSIGFMLAYAHALPNKDWKFGADMAYSYADASCDATTIKSDVVYFDLALMYDRKRFHQMGTLGVAMFSFDTEREARVNAAGRSYAGKADGSTNALEFNLSYEMNYDLVVKDQHKLSSVVLAEASFAQFDSMTESGMGNAGLNSEWDDTANLTFGLGGRYTYTFGEEKNPGYFMAEALFVAETGDTMPKVSNSFIGGGAAFDQEGPDAGDCGLRLNAGVLVPLGDQWGVFGNVTSEFRENQTGVGGSVGVKCSF